MRTLVEDVKSNWILIVFIGSLIITWTTFSARLTQAEDDIKDLKIVISQINSTSLETNTRLTRIETSVEFIKNNMKEAH